MFHIPAKELKEAYKEVSKREGRLEKADQLLTELNELVSYLNDDIIGEDTEQFSVQCNGTPSFIGRIVRGKVESKQFEVDSDNKYKLYYNRNVTSAHSSLENFMKKFRPSVLTMLSTDEIETIQKTQPTDKKRVLSLM